MAPMKPMFARALLVSAICIFSPRSSECVTGYAKAVDKAEDRQLTARGGSVRAVAAARPPHGQADGQHAIGGLAVFDRLDERIDQRLGRRSRILGDRRQRRAC